MIGSAVISYLAFLAFTGAACGEGIFALIAGGVVGVAWAYFASRSRLTPAARKLGGAFVLLLVAMTTTLVGRTLAPGMTFRAAFSQSPPRSVKLLQCRRFGFIDNTSFLRVSTDEATIQKLIADTGFTRFDDAERELRPYEGSNNRERSFRTTVSVGGVLSDELPFHEKLSVFRKSSVDAATQSPTQTVTVTWDPTTRLAYVYVAGF